MNKLLEIRKLLAHIDPTKANGRITSDHIINLLQEVNGDMDTDLPWMLEYIDSFLAQAGAEKISDGAPHGLPSGLEAALADARERPENRRGFSEKHCG